MPAEAEALGRKDGRGFLSVEAQMIRGSGVDDGNGVVLAHRRLSIIDLSATGHRPMCSANGALCYCI